MIGMREITYLSIIIRVVSAFLLGGVLGLEREVKKHAAGLRTHMLVCVGSCMIMVTNQYIYQAFGVGDPVRMGAQVVSGIGFLGAGTIMVTKWNKITGLTTAAGLWASAAVGLAVGIGLYELAVVGAVLIVTILTLVHMMDKHIRGRSRGMTLYAEVDHKISIGVLSKHIRGLGVEIESIQIDRDYSTDGNLRALVITILLPKKTNRKDMFHKLHEIDGVMYLEEV